MSMRVKSRHAHKVRSTQPSYAINDNASETPTDIDLPKSGNGYSLNSDNLNIDQKHTKHSNDTNMDSDVEIMYDKEALTNSSNKDSFHYINKRMSEVNEGLINILFLSFP